MLSDSIGYRYFGNDPGIFCVKVKISALSVPDSCSFNLLMHDSGFSTSVSNHSSAATKAVLSHFPVTIMFVPSTDSIGTVTHLPLTLISMFSLVGLWVRF